MGRTYSLAPRRDRARHHLHWRRCAQTPAPGRFGSCNGNWVFVIAYAGPTASTHQRTDCVKVAQPTAQINWIYDRLVRLCGAKGAPLGGSTRGYFGRRRDRSAVPVWRIGWSSVLYIYTSPSSGRMSASAADRVESCARHHLDPCRVARSTAANFHTSPILALSVRPRRRHTAFSSPETLVPRHLRDLLDRQATLQVTWHRARGSPRLGPIATGWCRGPLPLRRVRSAELARRAARRPHAARGGRR